MSVCCDTCVFNMPIGDGQCVCVGRTDLYSVDIGIVKKIYSFGCEEYEPTLDEFIYTGGELYINL